MFDVAYQRHMHTFTALANAHWLALLCTVVGRYFMTYCNIPVNIKEVGGIFLMPQISVSGQ